MEEEPESDEDHERGHDGDIEQGDAAGELVLAAAQVFLQLADLLGVADLFLSHAFFFLLLFL